ncbi:peptide chain release factor 2 [Steroidobacter sp.]|uniref:peptide chain release factor 2 n=1 Tax=Steroidobacter sp. TaxID=1978227 RepID=UPI002FDD6416
MEINPILRSIEDLTERSGALRGFFDYDTKSERLAEVTRELEDPAIWNTPDRAQELGRERARLEQIVGTLDRVDNGLKDASELLEMAVAENEPSAIADVERDIAQLEAQVKKLEFQRMFPGEMDAHSCFLDIQAGAGGTEAQDWAAMLMRMYLRWGDQHGYKTEVVDVNDGEVAGIKSCTINFSGDYAYGWLRTETGVHRLVRKSPFDSNARRHTSFASVFVSPEVDEDIQIDINPADLKTDVYRSSGAGGQHVNKTESAVRITHVPTGIVVACQAERSQHKNRDKAMKMLKAKLYELEVNKRNAAAKVLEDSKSDVSWGNQIRSYVLDQSRIKDLRTNVEVGATDKVLDGDLDQFLEASLKQGL